MRSDSGKLKIIVTYLISYLIGITVTVRHFSKIMVPVDQQRSLQLFIIFFLLMTIESLLSNRLKWTVHIYILLQSLVIMLISHIRPIQDYYAILFIILILQSSMYLSLKSTYLWSGFFAAIISASLLYYFNAAAGIPYILTYAVIYVGVCSFITFMHSSEKARNESRQLYEKLQIAHDQLKEYSDKAEEMAVLQYRNRLAGNLHDSVTQTIFGLTMTTESALIQFEKDPSKVPALLKKMQTLSKSALLEMRSLIFELRSDSNLENGFIPTLEDHFAKLKQINNLDVQFLQEGELSLTEEQGLQAFRIIQESLNNVIKYADVEKAFVSLRCDGKKCAITIEDDGIGFESRQNKSENQTFGLSGMKERVENLKGSLSILSSPGNGTKISVEIPIVKGDDDHV